MKRPGPQTPDNKVRLWREQCDATRGIRQQFGSENALEYLVGQKLLTFVDASTDDPTVAAALPQFVAEVRAIFDRGELRDFLSSRRRLRNLARGGDMIVVERMKSLLLEHDRLGAA